MAHLSWLHSKQLIMNHSDAVLWLQILDIFTGVVLNSDYII